MLWPQMAANGSAIVFERDFGIWQYEVRTTQVRQLPITLRGVSASRGVERQTITQGFAADLSSDGKKLALIGRGELWASDARESGRGLCASRAHRRWRNRRSGCVIGQGTGASCMSHGAPMAGASCCTMSLPTTRGR
ncbi:hypothetical protein [Gemmatimonas sp.]|uniref:hypothetical protein n=1 Tax=Gemmatimonas sp. TaxID=1962908 RepID=UPI003DA56300